MDCGEHSALCSSSSESELNQTHSLLVVLLCVPHSTTQPSQPRDSELDSILADLGKSKGQNMPGRPL